MLPDEKKFRFADGTAVATLSELKDKIETVSYDEFYSHVNAEKNDFANWVEHVLNEHDVAAKLRAVGSIVETVEILNETLYPDETEYHEAELQEQQQPDIQAEIERKIFGDVEAPAPSVEEGVPEIKDESVSREMVEEAARSTEAAKPEQPESAAEPAKEAPASAGPGEPRTTKEPGHVPITKVVNEKLDEKKEEHYRRTAKEFVWGLLLGLIFGFILGVIIKGIA